MTSSVDLVGVDKTVIPDILMLLKLRFFWWLNAAKFWRKLTAKSRRKIVSKRTQQEAVTIFQFFKLSKKNFAHDNFTRIVYNPEMIVMKKVAWFQEQKVPLCLQVDFDLTLIKVTRQTLFTPKDDVLDCFCNVLISFTNYFPKIP